ncbi:phage holin family protein [Peptoniphilus equinus]|uniref:Phage holin family protein n=1 Tax=Peptoniphilus equinus TaxID=3016343 RepID=A0ABY7QT50_9FIRM|nr:phage holin family protein [Peptoniphilus equinus]WBW49970.1 phage holin family protein [Peptoniphilus equinus]
MRLIVKIFVSALSIGIAAALSPMQVSNFSAAIVAAVVMGLINWGIENFTTVKSSSLGRGLSGFLIGALVIFITGQLVDGFHAGIFGALIGAFVLGIVSAVIPGEKTY